MAFESTIKDWIINDKELQTLNDRIKQLRARRTELDSKIIEYTRESEIKKTFKYGDVVMKVLDVNISETITFKYLERCLSDMVKNENQVKQMMDYIKRNRTVRTVSHVERVVSASK